MEDRLPVTATTLHSNMEDKEACDTFALVRQRWRRSAGPLPRRCRRGKGKNEGKGKNGKRFQRPSGRSVQMMDQGPVVLAAQRPVELISAKERAWVAKDVGMVLDAHADHS